jgi:NAD-dependent deacetylase
MNLIETGQALPPELIMAVQDARSIAVLTGAGVSAESGVPTFRAAQTGLWAKHDPMTLASPQGFARDPALVWDWYQWRRKLIAEARPNAGHHALAELDQATDELVVITQNVDGFHQLAGSNNVLELHGNIQRTICSVTRKPIAVDWLDQHADTHPPPSPHDSHGLARPDVVWFGEALDADILNAAFTAAEQCDLMIVAGTAGVVHPAASIPPAAVRAGACMIDINPQTSELTHLAHWHLSGPSGYWLPLLAKARRQ